MAAMTVFSLLGLPVRFAQDEETILAGWRRAIAMVHPDRFAGRPAAERRVAEQWAGRINEARDALLDPVARAQAILALQGADLGAQTDTRMDPAFLMQQMRWREALMDAEGDAAALAALTADVERCRDELTAAITRALDEDHDTAAARESVRRLMFVQKMCRELRGERAAL